MSAVGLLGAALICGSATIAHADPAPRPVNFGFEGQPEFYFVPSGVSSVAIAGMGGDGGGPRGGGRGAKVQGTLAVTPGELLRVSVGGKGGGYASGYKDIPGGWGGLGAVGGIGNGAKHDYLRSSASGGGATTVEALIGGQWQPVFIAGGGGGTGGPSGDQISLGFGGSGSAGYCTPTTGSGVWTGAGGSTGTPLTGGKGGAGGAESGMAGGRGQGGSGLGGNGGGGGGGSKGGAGGGGAKGTSSGGGGGAGSSANYLLTGATVDQTPCAMDGKARATITPQS